MHIHLDRENARPLYQQLAQDIQQRIRSGALPAGARLPTVRELAQQLGVTRLTVHTAYSELQAGGWVEATVGRGTFVANQGDQQMSSALDLGREFSPHGMISDMLRMAQIPGMRSLAMADAAAEFYPKREFARALEEAVVHDSAATLGYTTSQGEPLLRNVLAEFVRQRGIHAGPDELVVTSGVTQGIALLARTLASPGDTVIVEQPTYVGALNILGAQQLRVVGAPMDAEGMLVDRLEALIVAHKPRFIYTIPAFQNPSGVCLSPDRRAMLLTIAERYRVPVVEDDIYSLIAFERPAPTALKANDPADVVIHVSSFSKSALPGVRIGYIVAPPQIVKRLVAVKQADDLCSPPLMQRAMAIFIERGWFAAHLRRTIPRYRDRRDTLLTAMTRYFPAGLRWTTPEGGFSTWVTLPQGISATDLYLAAIERGVAFAPGDFFFAGPAPRPYMRLSFSGQPPEVLTDVTRSIGELLAENIHRRTFVAPPISEWVPLV